MKHIYLVSVAMAILMAACSTHPPSVWRCLATHKQTRRSVRQNRCRTQGAPAVKN